MNASSLFTRDVGLKMLCLKVEENVSIPRIRGADEEERFVGERISRFDVFIDTRKRTDELDKHQGFFGFRLRKLKIKFLKNNDPFLIFFPKYLTCQDVVHGVGVYDYHGGA
jgi:hypothetical protein